MLFSVVSLFTTVKSAISIISVKDGSNEGLPDRIRKIHRRNLQVGVYPGSAKSAFIFTSIIQAFNNAGIDATFGLTKTVENFLNTNELISLFIASILLWWGLCIVRKFILRQLLQYRGWLYEGRKPSIATQLFVVSVRLLGGWFKPLTTKLYGMQGILPTLPIPPVDQTVARYLESMKPFLDEDQYASLEKSGNEFLQTIGTKLQRYLIFKSWFTENYVSQWWEDYVYLMGRSPLLVNSNFYCIDGVDQPRANRAARAALFTKVALTYRKSIEDQTHKPLIGQGVIPLCSSQYERLFNTTRIPGETMDRIQHVERSDYIIVYHLGRYFQVPVYHSNGNELSKGELQDQIIQILNDKSEPAEGEEKLAALTAWDRTNWAKARSKFFSFGINKTSLDIIEKAAYTLIFDEEEYSPDVYREDTTHLDFFAKHGLHGNGYNRWCDKSFNIVIDKNGIALLHCEHSWADAPIVSQLAQIVHKNTLAETHYDANNYLRYPVEKKPPTPRRLSWNLKGEAAKTIEMAVEASRKLVENTDIKCMSHNAFGKGLMKKCRVSPDAFIQMAIQLAYFRGHGKFVLTYEASMTRFYKFGRTETVRSATEESCKWVKAMDSSATTREEKIALFTKAWEKHQDNYRLAMSGKGFDRHLFGLYVVSKYLKIESDFLHNALTQPWLLSTSQTPTWQETMETPPLLTSGGGFGPTAADGYGVSYIVSGDHGLIFHVSSNKDSPITDSTKFVMEIKRALDDIRKMHGIELDNRIPNGK